MIYGYLRVSSDEQDVNNQKLGVDSFAQAKNFHIDEYIKDEGVSGGKDPSKRKLGPLLEKLQKGDVLICSEISRLGRDLYMVMDILHHCMEVGCVIYTVKDKFVLGDDIQSKVLAFAFGLSAEIERQMIRQRTTEGLRLRVKLGILLGRPPKGACKNLFRILTDEQKEQIVFQYKLGVPGRKIAENLGIDRNTIDRFIVMDGHYQGSMDALERKKKMIEKLERQVKQNKEAYRVYKLENEKYDPANFTSEERERVKNYVIADLTIPEIHKKFDSKYTYQQVYDYFIADVELNNLYREHAQKILLAKFGKRKDKHAS